MSGSVPKRRLESLDLMQGIAMLWVVVGHHLLPFMPSEYGSFHHYIYAFHMPLFIWISGFLMAYSYKGGSYGTYLGGKLRKFFVPYILVGGAVAILFSFREGASLVDNLYNLALYPKESETTFLWYIYLLTFLYALYPLLVVAMRRFGRWAEGIILATGIVLYLYPIPTGFLCLDYFSRYFLFFIIGVYAGQRVDILSPWGRELKMLGVAALLLFAVASVVSCREFTPMLYRSLAFLAIPAMYGLAYICMNVRVATITLTTISRNCFRIYLFHMFMVQAVAIAFAAVWNARIESIWGMVVYVALSTLASIGGVILIGHVYERFRILTSKSK